VRLRRLSIYCGWARHIRDTNARTVIFGVSPA